MGWYYEYYLLSSFDLQPCIYFTLTLGEVRIPQGAGRECVEIFCGEPEKLLFSPLSPLLQLMLRPVVVQY